MDHREHARLAAIISRRRKQLFNLEQQVIDVRRKLDEDERELARFKSEPIPVNKQFTPIVECHSAAKTLNQCRRKGKGARMSSEACREAGQALKMCSKKKPSES
jgi:hypothetical protein|eukprot:7384356-Prymnesium_polylepis.4